MTTTAVFAEMLVAGIEALVWIALLALAIAQPCESDLHRLAPLKDWAALITVVLLAIAYGVGVVVDRMSDSLFDRVLDQWVTAKAPSKNDDPNRKKTPVTKETRAEEKARIRSLRLDVLARGDKVTDAIEYIRSRLRVARSTTLNLALTTIAAEAFLLRCTGASPCQISASALSLAFMTGVAAMASKEIRETHDRWLCDAAMMPSKSTSGMRS